MKIENFDLDQYLELVFKYEFDWYITYNFLGKNNEFTWKTTICFSQKLLIDFVNNIKKLDIWNYAEINDNDSDSFIKVTKNTNKWHFTIIYQLGWSHQDNFCRLILNTDSIWISKFESLI